MQYIQACLLTKQNFFWCFDAGLEHMAVRSRGNGTNFDWLRKSCDISTCDLSPDGNPEKYGRPMISAIDWHYTMAWLPESLLKKTHRRLSTYATTMRVRFVYERRRYATMAGP